MNTCYVLTIDGEKIEFRTKAEMLDWILDHPYEWELYGDL